MAKIRAVLAYSIAAFFAAAAVGYADDSKSVSAKDSVEIKATVEEVHPEDRSLVLKGETGERAVVVAGPEVRNFDQIKAGDQVSLVYHVALAAELKPRGTPTSAPTESTIEKRAPPGTKPSGSLGRTVATTVQIESVDTSFNTVTFKKADGITRTVAVEDPDARKFIRTLKPGDPVEIKYTEAVAVSVQPTRR
jgi:hypothetical protein